MRNEVYDEITQCLSFSSKVAIIPLTFRIPIQNNNITIFIVWVRNVVSLRKEHKLQVYENEAFGPKKDDGKGKCKGKVVPVF
jgi:hypothetical protein